MCAENAVPTDEKDRFERGPLQDFEVVWRTGHAEVIQAHQVSYQRGGFLRPDIAEVVQFHAEIDGRWLLVLRVLGADLRMVRNLTQTEQREEADRG